MGCPIPVASPLPGLRSLPEPRVGSALLGAVATCPAALPLAFLPPRLAPPALRLPSRPGEARPGPAQPRFTREELLGCPRAGVASGSLCEQQGVGWGCTAAVQGVGCGRAGGLLHASPGFGDRCWRCKINSWEVQHQLLGAQPRGHRAVGCSAGGDSGLWGTGPTASQAGVQSAVPPGWGAGGCNANQEGAMGCSARARASGVQCQLGQ